MNTVEISSNLTLEIDLKKVKYRQEKSGSDELHKLDDKVLENYPEITQSLEIFKEIELIKKDVNEEI
jgi:hypothetical protein